MLLSSRPISYTAHVVEERSICLALCWRKEQELDLDLDLDILEGLRQGDSLPEGGTDEAGRRYIAMHWGPTSVLRGWHKEWRKQNRMLDWHILRTFLPPEETTMNKFTILRSLEWQVFETRETTATQLDKMSFSLCLLLLMGCLPFQSEKFDESHLLCIHCTAPHRSGTKSLCELSRSRDEHVPVLSDEITSLSVFTCLSSESQQFCSSHILCCCHLKKMERNGKTRQCSHQIHSRLSAVSG